MSEIIPATHALSEVLTPEEAAYFLEVVSSEPTDQHPVAVYLASLSAGSRRSMAGALKVMAQLVSGGRCDAHTLPWQQLRFQHTMAIRAALSEKYAPASANHHLAALRGVLKACWNLDLMPTEAYHRAVHLPTVRGETLPRGRALASGELRALFSLCMECANREARVRPAGVRDAAFLGVLYGSGLRRSEAVALDAGDYNAENGALTVKRGKGRKARITYLPTGAREAMSVWLELRQQVLAEDAGPLFLPVLKSGRIVVRRLTDQAVLTILVKRAKQAGVKHLSPHDLRRTFISDLLDAGADISTVQKLAGHANVTTTARYDRRGEATKQKAAELLHVPFHQV